MVIGAVLLQPQRLERARQIPADDAVLSDIISLAVRLFVDDVQGGRLGEALARSFEGTVARLATRAGAGVNSAVTRFGTLFAPLIESVAGVVEQPPGEVSDLLDGLENGVTSLVHMLKTLTPEPMRQGISTVFDIVETDLGITPTFIGDMVLGLFDDMILALASALPDETPDERANRRAVAAVLRRLQRYMQAHFTFPTWNADAVAQALLTLRQNPDVDAALTRALCSGEAALTYLRTGGTLIDLLPYSAFASFGEGSLGAAAAPPAPEEVSFYASKLLEYDNYDGKLGVLPLAPNDNLVDGEVPVLLRDAFLHVSVVLARAAFLYTVEPQTEWQVVDRKKYVIHKTENSLWVYRLCETSLRDFLLASRPDQEDKRELRKILHKNGIPVRSSSPEVMQDPVSNTWNINTGGLHFIGTRVENILLPDQLSIRPATQEEALFTLPVALQPTANEKTPASALRQAFESYGIPLSPRCSLSVRAPDSEWLLEDGDFAYTIKRDEGKFEVSTGGFWGLLRSTIAKPKGDMVWVNRERTQVLLGQRIMHTGSNVSWHDAPIFRRLNGNRHYSLQNQATTVEGWAHHTSWIQDAVNAVVHAIKIGLAFDQGEGEYSVTSNSLNTGRMISEVVVKLAQHRPMAALIGSDFLYDLLLDLGTYGVKGVEALVKPSASGPPTTASDFSQVVDKILSAVLGVEIVDTHWSALPYEFILSLLTLLNHIEPAEASQKRPENYKENSGFVDLFWKGALLGYTALIPDEEYELPFQTAEFTLQYGVGGALGVGLTMGFVGLLVGQGVCARVNPFADGRHVAKTLVKSTGKSLAYFWPYLKLVKGKNT